MASLSNAPNPFNPATTISYNVPNAGWVKVTIYTVAGERVDMLVDKYHTAGPYSVNWEAQNARGEILSSGIYLATLEIGGVMQTHKMVHLK